MSAVLKVNELSFAYAARLVLSKVSFQLNHGACLGLLGPNGSGKSTLIRCLAGILQAQQGSIELAGVNPRLDPIAAKRALGFAPNPEALPPQLTVRQCLQVFAYTRQLSQIPEQSLQDLDRLGALRWLDSLVGTLSLGTRQKVAVVLGLMEAAGEPKLLILDEVFNGLDPLSAFALKQIVRERLARGIAVILATHGLDFAAELFDDLLLLHEGQVLRTWQGVELKELAAPGQLERAIVAELKRQEL